MGSNPIIEKKNKRKPFKPTKSKFTKSTKQKALSDYCKKFINKLVTIKSGSFIIRGKINKVDGINLILEAGTLSLIDNTTGAFPLDEQYEEIIVNSATIPFIGIRRD